MSQRCVATGSNDAVQAMCRVTPQYQHGRAMYNPWLQSHAMEQRVTLEAAMYVSQIGGVCPDHDNPWYGCNLLFSSVVATFDCPAHVLNKLLDCRCIYHSCQVCHIALLQTCCGQPPHICQIPKQAQLKCVSCTSGVHCQLQ